MPTAVDDDERAPALVVGAGDDQHTAALVDGAGHGHKKRKKKDKRKVHDDDAADDGEPKKKSKKRAREADGAGEGLENGTNASAVESGAADLVAADDEPRKKRRKKKQDAATQAIDPALQPFLSDAPAHSNEEILRMLQSVDISKVDLNAVFKNLKHSTPITDAHDSLSSSSTQRKRRPEPVPAASSSRAPSNPAPPPPARSENTEEHRQALATKWLSSKQLNHLVETEGLLLKKGKFSNIEEHAIKTAIEKYRVEHNLTEEELSAFMFTKGKRTEPADGFWSEITLAVPQRCVVGVYHYVKRAYHPLGKQGKWDEDEDAALLRAVGDVGQAWEKVSEHVGRAAGDCRDRYRNHLAHRDVRAVGKWAPDEEAELTRIVRAMTLDLGKTADSDVFWSEVSNKMDNRRTRQQCRIKWTDALNKVVKSDGGNPRWSERDGLILVQRVAALDVHDDSEINWNVIIDEAWNLWSAHQLQRRWLTLKRSVKGHEHLAFADLLEILKGKKGVPDDPTDIPSADEQPRKEKRRAKKKKRDARSPAQEQMVSASEAEG